MGLSIFVLVAMLAGVPLAVPLVVLFSPVLVPAALAIAGLVATAYLIQIAVIEFSCFLSRS